MSSVCALAGLPIVIAALLTSTAHAQDGAIDMTGMGIYAQEEAVEEAARERPAAKGARRQVQTKPVRSLAESCAILRANIARMTPAEVRTYRLGCK